MTGYQETLTDPSYAGQIITFTFPHIGNVGANPEDIEATTIAARGLVVKQDVTEPSNWRAAQHLDAWLRAQGMAGHRRRGHAGADHPHPRRRRAERRAGLPRRRALRPARRCGRGPRRGRGWRAWTSRKRGIVPADVRAGTRRAGPGRPAPGGRRAPRHHVVAVDYGAKRNILRCLASAGCRVTVVPATATAEDILRHQPDGVFLSNGPGDPAATAEYAVPAIRGVLEAGVPLFGICLGHQLLALALGAKTYKLDRGHRGANQPVKELATGRGGDHQPEPRLRGGCARRCRRPSQVTHMSACSTARNEGLACTDRPAFSVQYHPEASPGPSDSHHLFRRFVGMMERAALMDAVDLVLSTRVQPPHQRAEHRGGVRAVPGADRR